jgi:phosphotransferase system HPr (HPr) family protein
MNSLKDYTGEVCLACTKGTCDKISILGLMSLGLEYCERVTIQVSGENEEQVCRDLVELFETEFDFPPRPEGSDQ